MQVLCSRIPSSALRGLFWKFSNVFPQNYGVPAIKHGAERSSLHMFSFAARWSKSTHPSLVLLSRWQRSNPESDTILFINISRSPPMMPNATFEYHLISFGKISSFVHSGLFLPSLPKADKLKGRGMERCRCAPHGNAQSFSK